MKALMSAAALGLTCLSGGCANLFAVHQTNAFEADGETVAIQTSVDAKQRIVLGVRHKDNEGTGTWRFCAEPSPDALAVLSASLSGSAGLTSEKERQELASSVTSAFAEGASTINRSQTVNLLREQMFRTCERYATGALGEEEFTIQSARDQRALVAILAIEQLTGVQQLEAQRLGGAAYATGASGSLATIDRARQQWRQATLDADSSEQLFNKNFGAKLVDENGKKVCPKSGDDAAACTAAHTQAATLRTREKDAQQHYDTAVRFAQDAHASTAADAGPAGRTVTLVNLGDPSYPAALGGPSTAQPIHMSDQKYVADKVAEIVKQSFDFNEAQMLCIRLALQAASGKKPFETWPRLGDTCAVVLETAAQFEAVTKSSGSTSEALNKLLELSYQPRVFFQISRDSQRAKASRAIGQLEELYGDNVRIARGVETRRGESPMQNDVRYFHSEDKVSADAIATALKESGIVTTPVTTRQLSLAAPRGQIEVWIGTAEPD